MQLGVLTATPTSDFGAVSYLETRCAHALWAPLKYHPAVTDIMPERFRSIDQGWGARFQVLHD